VVRFFHTNGEDNKTYSSDITIVRCNTISATNITISNNCDVIIDGIEDIVINAPFVVESGSSLELKF
jgi:hypothetical protein